MDLKDQDLTGKSNTNPTNPFTQNQSDTVKSNQSEPPPKRRSLKSSQSSGTLIHEDMNVGRTEGIQLRPISPDSPSFMLHKRLEGAGAYERLDTRRRSLLQTYLTTENPIQDLGYLPEVQLKSRPLLSNLAHSAMKDAFNELPESERADYDNDPEVAFRTRSAQKTELSVERHQEALDELRNPETGKVEYSETHRQNTTASNQKRSLQIQEGTYNGKPLGGWRPGAGRPRKSGETPKNEVTGEIELPDTHTQSLREADREADLLRLKREREAQRTTQSENKSGRVTSNQSVTDTGRRSLKARSSFGLQRNGLMRKSEEAKQGIPPEKQLVVEHQERTDLGKSENTSEDSSWKFGGG